MFLGLVIRIIMLDDKITLNRIVVDLNVRVLSRNLTSPHLTYSAY